MDGHKAELARSVIKGFDALKSKRGSFDSWLKDITFYVLPEYESQESGAKDTMGNPDRPVSSVATQASIKLGGNLYSYTYSQGDKNFALRAPDGNESDDLKEWLEGASEACIKAIQNSNFSEVYGEMCTLFSTFGTGPVSTEWDEERGELILRNQSINGDVYLMEDKDGRINGVVRCLRYTAAQALEKYGEDYLPKKILKAADDPAKMGELFDFIHMIRKRAKRNPKLDDVKNMAYESIHVCKAEECVVKESGYRVFPFAAPRFFKVRDFPYGYGAGHFAVNAIRELNKAESDLRDAIEIAGKPPVFTPDEDSAAERLEPGRMIFTDMTNGRPVPYQTGADLATLFGRVQQLSQQIESQFFLDVFMALSSPFNERDKTATEANLIENEKLSSIGPMVSRLRSEFWVPFIERVLDLLIENGRIMPPPGGDADYKIVYTSRIDAQLAAINATESIRAVNEVAQLLGLRETAPGIDRVAKLDEVCTQLLEDRNLPQEFIVSLRERSEMDQAAAQAEQQAKQEEAMAGPMSKLDPTKAPEDGSMMDQLSKANPMPTAPGA